MSAIDSLFRAFEEYRKTTTKDKSLGRLRSSVADSNRELDVLESVKLLCSIDEDWIIEIEKGLEFVEKCVKEERQFIRTNGEIVPIEKVKKVSKDSVAHLARHSNMITHVPEDEDATLVPDKIYMVEKLSDYAVYENRFVYMLLCYLRDFLQLRIDKITEIISTYRGDFIQNKVITEKRKTIRFEVKFHEERTDNPYPVIDEITKSRIQRIKDCQSIVMALLATDLMSQVAKAPMVKPPIIKTNVLKMNNNFKNALALYDYVVAYTKKGYEVEEIKKTITPLSEDVADEYAEILSLTSFLTYQYGNDLKTELRKHYDEEEKAQEALEKKKLIEQLKALKRRIQEAGDSYEEYMLLLEKRNKMLEHDNEEMMQIKNQVEDLSKELESTKNEVKLLNAQIKDLNNVIKKKNIEIDALNKKYIDDIRMIDEMHQAEIEVLKDKFLEMIMESDSQHYLEIEGLKIEFKKAMDKLRAEYEEKIRLLIEEYEAKLLALRNEYEEKLREQKEFYEAEIEKIKAECEEEKQRVIEECEDRIKEMEAEFNSEKERIAEGYEVQISELNDRINNFEDEKEEALGNLEASMQERIDELIELNESASKAHAEEVEALNKLCEEKDQKVIDTINEKNQECEKALMDSETAKFECKKEIERINNEAKEKIDTVTLDLTNKYDAIKEEFDELKEKYEISMGQLHGLRAQHGLITSEDDFTSKERFDELEAEFYALYHLLEDSLKEVKKKIRKEILWTIPKKEKKTKKNKEPEVEELSVELEATDEDDSASE